MMVLLSLLPVGLMQGGVGGARHLVCALVRVYADGPHEQAALDEDGG